MKKIRRLISALFCSLIVACSNPASHNPNPSPGTVEAKLLTGTGAPSASTGANGDLYLETTGAVLYVKYNDAWSNVATLQGPAGLSGNSWLTGTTAPGDGAGADGDLYLDTSFSKIYKKTAGAWSSIADLQGQSTVGGAAWLSGEGAPSSGQGKDGDMYLDSGASIIYQKRSGAWANIVSLDGTPGPEGRAGSVWYSGPSEPDAALGIDGDFYLCTVSTTVLKKTSGQWTSQIASLKGPSGLQGNDGASWGSGLGAPETGSGASGDFYLDTGSKTIYLNENGAWSPIGPSLQGARGDTGVAGLDGADGSVWYVDVGAPNTKPAFGKDGDFYLAKDSSDVYVKASGSWSSAIANIKGAIGSTGATGAQGATGSQGPIGLTGPAGVKGDVGSIWHVGLGSPATDVGQNGDFYLDSSSSDVYVKTSGSWSSTIANIKGAIGSTGATGTQGATGAQGATGSQGPIGLTGPAGVKGDVGSIWHVGLGSPATDVGQNGDFYLDSNSSNVYVKTSGSWSSSIANIKGATGSTGAAGAQGTAGAQGATGLTGAAGADGTVWYVESGDPRIEPFGSGKNGDFYLDCSTSKIYKKSSGEWTLHGTLAAGISGASISVIALSLPEIVATPVDLYFNDAPYPDATDFNSNEIITVSTSFYSPSGSSFSWRLDGKSVGGDTETLDLNMETPLSFGNHSVFLRVESGGLVYSSPTCSFVLHYFEGEE
jgi:hypothetical protein